MLSSIRNVKSIKMIKLNMFITAVCVLFLILPLISSGLIHLRKGF